MRSKNKCILFVIVSLTYINVSKALQIGPLLSTCVDACERGCTEIRKIQSKRENGNGEMKVYFKDEADPRSALTEADEAAQRAIVGSLKAEWEDKILIIGEEDDNDDDKNPSIKSSYEPLRRQLFENDIGETADIDPSDITIFVDPLDGTREFVENRLQNCQVLVGVAIDGEAVAGAIGIPFPAGDLSEDASIVYGLVDVGSGVRGTPLRRGPFPLDHHIDGVKYPRPHAASGDSKSPVMVACREAAIEKFGGSCVHYGGAGNKILAAALGEVSCTFSHRVGGPWDLCAPEAVLKSMGGKMTDLFGEDIAIYKSDAPVRCNERGFLATTPGSENTYHQALANAMLARSEVQKYCRDLGVVN